MPKTAILSDIHGNLHALRAVLAEIDAMGIEEIVCGGDTVGYGSQSAACVALIRERSTLCVLGNHGYYLGLLATQGRGILPERWKLNPVWAGIALAEQQLDKDALEWLDSLPWINQLEGSVLVHASLHEPEKWHYLTDVASTLATIEILRGKKRNIGFFGHTHRLAIFADPKAHAKVTGLGTDRFFVPANLACAITCGSVGQPREVDDHRASWVLWDPDERVIEFRRTKYPAIKAAKEILAAGLPPVSASRLLSQKETSEL